MDPRLLVELAIAAAGAGLWLLAFWGALLATRPRAIPAQPPTQDFGGKESPAVVSLITSRWELTEDAAESTLIDLAARRVLEFRQPGNDPLQTTVHVRDARPAGLNGYETMIFEHVQSLSMNGMVPLTALTFRDAAQAKAWTRRLNAAIVADARSRGLSQRRFSPAVVTALTAFAAVPAFAIAFAVALYTRRHGDDPMVGIGFLIFGWAGFGYLAGRSRGERDTEAGRVAAARWLGLKAFLRNQESFADLPPAAVTVWDRYLSYGDAVGATRVCSAVIDLGMGNRRKVWSAFGGTWHRVRVAYPSFFRRYGQKPLPLLLKALAAFAVTLLLVRGMRFVSDFSDISSFNAIVLVPLVYGGYTLIGLAVDVLTPVTVHGEVLWVETWKSRSQGEDEPSIPWLHYLAVDDGSSDRTTAWACPSELAGRVSNGAVVTLTARRWTRRVLTLEVHARGRGPAAGYTDENTERLIARAMNAGAPALATAVRPAKVVPSSLVTPDEVGRVLGAPARLTGSGHALAVGPIALATYQAADGSALVLGVAIGDAADLAIRAHRGGRPVANVGDEAFASGQWVVARRGAVVVTIEQRTTGPIHQPYLVWLLGLAVNRLT